MMFVGPAAKTMASRNEQDYSSESTFSVRQVRIDHPTPDQVGL